MRERRRGTRWIADGWQMDGREKGDEALWLGGLLVVLVGALWLRTYFLCFRCHSGPCSCGCAMLGAISNCI